MHTCCIRVDGRKRVKMKTMTKKIAGACVCSMPIEFSLSHSVQFYRFSVDSRKRIKTVVWTQIDRCDFDDNENSYFWKRISVDRAWTYVCLFTLISLQCTCFSSQVRERSVFPVCGGHLCYWNHRNIEEGVKGRTMGGVVKAINYLPSLTRSRQNKHYQKMAAVHATSLWDS